MIWRMTKLKKTEKHKTYEMDRGYAHYLKK